MTTNVWPGTQNRRRPKKSTGANGLNTPSNLLVTRLSGRNGKRGRPSQRISSGARKSSSYYVMGRRAMNSTTQSRTLTSLTSQSLSLVSKILLLNVPTDVPLLRLCQTQTTNKLNGHSFHLPPRFALSVDPLRALSQNTCLLPR